MKYILICSLFIGVPFKAVASQWMSTEPTSEKAEESPAGLLRDFSSYDPNRFITPFGPKSGRLFFKFKSENGKIKLLNTIDSGLGGAYASIGDDGALSLSIADKAFETLTQQQLAFFTVLEEAIIASGVMVIRVLENSINILCGSFSAKSIDIDDIQALGDGPGMNQHSVLGHEIKEQFEKQVNGKARPEAHAAGEIVEKTITGYSRLSDSPMRNKKVEKIVIRRPMEGTQTFYTTSGTKDFIYQRGNQTIIVTVEILQRNIQSVTRR